MEAVLLGPPRGSIDGSRSSGDDDASMVKFDRRSNSMPTDFSRLESVSGSEGSVYIRKGLVSLPSLQRVGDVKHVQEVPGLADLSEKDLELNFKMKERGLDFPTYFYLNSVPEWRRKYVHYNKLLRILAQISITPSEQGAVSSSDAAVGLILITEHKSFSADVQSSAFFKQLAAELEKVEGFFVEQVKYFRKRYNSLLKQLDHFKDHKFTEDDPRPVQPFEASALLTKYVQELKEKRQIAIVRDSFKSAVYEFVRGMEMLQGYCSLNKLAALHLVNKYEALATKLSHVPHIAESVQDLVERCTFTYATAELLEMEEEINDKFFTIFHPGEKDEKELLRPDRIKRKYQRAAFFIGLCLGLIAAMFFLCIYLIVDTGDVQRLPDWQPVYLIFRGLILVQLAVWYTGVNMYGWRKALINFRFIAEIGRHRISHHQVHFFVGPLSVCTMLFFLLYLFSARGNLPSVMPPRFFAFIAFVLMFGVLVFPFNFFFRDTRWWLLRQSGRVVAAPFLEVRFTDFFLADQFTSLVVAFYDLEFSFCYVLSDIWTGGNACLVQIPIARLCLAGLPGLWRFLQCLRRYRDTRDTRNLVNAGKYASGLMVVLFAGLSKGLAPDNFGGLRIVLIIFSVVATCYSSYWDIIRDFGFFEKGSKHRFLRKELMYKSRWVYYTIIPVDVLLRCAWIFTIAPGNFGLTISSDLLVFVLAAAEVTRRFLWNFFRMENESANNCGNFRAVKDVPLPYDEADMEHDETVGADIMIPQLNAGGNPEEVRELLTRHFDDALDDNPMMPMVRDLMDSEEELGADEYVVEVERRVSRAASTGERTPPNPLTTPPSHKSKRRESSVILVEERRSQRESIGPWKEDSQQDFVIELSSMDSTSASSSSTTGDGEEEGSPKPPRPSLPSPPAVDAIGSKLRNQSVDFVPEAISPKSPVLRKMEIKASVPSILINAMPSSGNSDPMLNQERSVDDDDSTSSRSAE